MRSRFRAFGELGDPVRSTRMRLVRFAEADNPIPQPDISLVQIVLERSLQKVVDAIASATRQLKNTYNARAVVLVGHSGGGAIVRR
jgi:hypothetical protein